MSLSLLHAPCTAWIHSAPWELFGRQGNAERRDASQVSDTLTSLHTAVRRRRAAAPQTGCTPACCRRATAPAAPPGWAPGTPADTAAPPAGTCSPECWRQLQQRMRSDQSNRTCQQTDYPGRIKGSMHSHEALARDAIEDIACQASGKRLAGLSERPGCKDQVCMSPVMPATAHATWSSSWYIFSRRTPTADVSSSCRQHT